MLAVGACATLQPKPISDVNPYPATQNVVVDSHGTVKRFYGIPIDLTILRLRSLPYRVKLGQEMGEGDYYAVATIVGDRGVEVKVTFDDNGRLYLAETVSHAPLGRGVLKLDRPLLK
jgi:hypothetical protein